MFTAKRLDELYKTTEKVHINEHSQIVFMSDIHRGDNSVIDEFGQNRLLYEHALQYYYRDGYTYVEIGDGDELWEVSDYRKIALAHPAVFEALRSFQKAGRMVMISGNHNNQIIKPGYSKKYMERTYDDFLGEDIEILPGINPVEAIIFQYDPTGQELFVLHGHQGEMLSDYLSPAALFTNRYIWRYIHRAGIRYNANPTKSQYQPARREKVFKKWLKDHDLIMICGHTHRPRLSQPGEPPYFNTGCAIHPRGITCLELAFGEMVLVNWSLQTRRDGMIFVKRKIMKNPVRIDSFLTKQ